MSTADQLLSARIAAACRRHCARGVVDDRDQAVAELQEFAGDRPDLLAEHAGLSTGWAQAVAPVMAPGFRAEADLCRAAGADPEKIGQWIRVGRKRAEQARLPPHAGVPRQ
jgi:hypothetical protein